MPISAMPGTESIICFQLEAAQLLAIAGIDRMVRGWEKASEHAPIRLKTVSSAIQSQSCKPLHIAIAVSSRTKPISH